ncbi:CBS domain-containing protein [Haloarchaeobius amylolyticus]|uniref:CBS domain-containing protein n=1 Tax=Haloarchaeobius amylolyticus TaxID=1198296 RepID=UPI00226EBE2C|nr:CBS domain-containing protein [Haloarchaeobius amylolyticus]
MIETTVDSLALHSLDTVTPDTPVRDAAERLRCPSTPALTVVDGDTVVGTVTEADIVAMVAETGERRTVEYVMSMPVTISPAATLHDAADTMRATGVEYLPVVDETYCGLLSVDTLAPYLSRRTLDFETREESMPVEAAGTGELAAGD